MTHAKLIRGRAWVFGHNVDTDIIAPGDTISFGLGDASELEDVKRNAFRTVRPGLYKEVREGDILVAGRNFGLGSHREPANKALESLGFRAVIAESIARLFFRNAVAIGFHAFQVPAILSFVRDGDELEVDVDRAHLANLTQGTELALEPYSPLIRRIVEQGGILEVLKSRLEAEGR
jgi:3-isopropylmalate/(R)-2-methylmalate dehydratase small subunit